MAKGEREIKGNIINVRTLFIMSGVHEAPKLSSALHGGLASRQVPVPQEHFCYLSKSRIICPE